MKCEEFLRLLDDDVDVAHGAAGDHLDGCPSCRRAFERWNAVSGDLRAMRSDETPPFLHTRIMAHVNVAARVPERRAWWTRRPVWAMPAVVVALIVAAGGYGLFEVMRSRVEPVATIGDTERRDAASGPETKQGAREQIAEAVPAPALQQEATRVKSSESGARVNRDAPPRQAKDEKVAARRAEKRAAPTSFSKDDDGSSMPPDEQPRDALASNLATPSGSANRAVGGTVLGRMAASSEKAAAAPEPAAGVACLLTPLSGGPSIRVRLDAPTAPPAGVTWHVIVSPRAGVAVVTPEDVPVPVSAVAIERALVPLRPHAGRYTLQRTGVE